MKGGERKREKERKSLERERGRQKGNWEGLK